MHLDYQKNNVLRLIQYILFATGYYMIWRQGSQHWTEWRHENNLRVWSRWCKYSQSTTYIHSFVMCPVRSRTYLSWYLVDVYPLLSKNVEKICMKYILSMIRPATKTDLNALFNSMNMYYHRPKARRKFATKSYLDFYKMTIIWFLWISVKPNFDLWPISLVKVTIWNSTNDSFERADEILK